MQNDVFSENDVSVLWGRQCPKIFVPACNLVDHARIAHGHCGDGCGAEVRARVGPPVARPRCGHCSPSSGCCCCWAPSQCLEAAPASPPGCVPLFLESARPPEPESIPCGAHRAARRLCRSPHGIQRNKNNVRSLTLPCSRALPVLYRVCECVRTATGYCDKPFFQHTHTAYDGARPDTYLAYAL